MIFDQIITHEKEALENIPKDNIEEAVNLLFNINKVNKVVFSGMGKAGQIANTIATTFCSTGTPAVYIHPSEAQHGDLGLIQENDILFLISNSGQTKEVIEFANLSKNLHSNLKIIVLTSNPKSELAEDCDLLLLTGNPKEVGPLGLTPTTSTTVMGVIGDIITVNLMTLKNFTKKEYSKRHHSGYVGKKAKEE